MINKLPAIKMFLRQTTNLFIKNSLNAKPTIEYTTNVEAKKIMSAERKIASAK